MHKQLTRNRGRLPISPPSTAPDRRQIPTGSTIMPKTNPIYRTPHLPSFPMPQICKNEPNCHALLCQPRPNPGAPGNYELRTTLCQTNPIPARPVRKTKPIYRTAGILPAFPPPIAQNEPNYPFTRLADGDSTRQHTIYNPLPHRLPPPRGEKRLFSATGNQLLRS